MKEFLKIVSGGQTGVDRGALKAAIDLGLPWGGWAPKGWRSEDGAIPPKYRSEMKECASANYLVRTRKNVVDSHATLIITNTYPLSGGTLKTRHITEEAMRSHFVVSLTEEDAVGKVQLKAYRRVLCVLEEKNGSTKKLHPIKSKVRS